MLSQDNFPQVTKEAWLQQIRKDLKDKTLDSLDWIVSDTLRVSPVLHPEDQPLPPDFLHQGLSWKISETVHVEDWPRARAQALEALEGGVEALAFVLDDGFDALEELLDGMYLQMIDTHLSGAAVRANPSAVLRRMEQIAAKQGTTLSSARLSLGLDPSADQREGKQTDWRFLADLVRYAQEKKYALRLLQIDLRDQYADNENVMDAIVSVLRTAQHYAEQMSKHGVDKQAIFDSMEISVSIGPAYFLELAKLRALNLLWLHLQKSHGQSQILPQLSVSFHEAAYTDELYTNMVRATSMAMSAVLGGAARLTVRPYDEAREHMAKYTTAFGRRIARNVQHLLKMESHISQLKDPAAGSYYLENLTQELARQAWEKFNI
jgi:methylmalonyl-CoA mutase